MEREILIKKTIKNIEKLSDAKLKEVSDFIEFLISKIDDQILTEGIQKLASQSTSFKFLDDEQDIYTVNDIKEKYK